MNRDIHITAFILYPLGRVADGDSKGLHLGYFETGTQKAYTSVTLMTSLSSFRTARSCPYYLSAYGAVYLWTTNDFIPELTTIFIS